MKYKQQRQEKKKIVFVVDGAARNWKINLTNLLIKLALMAAAADPNKNNLLLFDFGSIYFTFLYSAKSVIKKTFTFLGSNQPHQTFTPFGQWFWLSWQSSRFQYQRSAV